MTTNQLHPLMIIFMCWHLLIVMMLVGTLKDRTYTNKCHDHLEKNSCGKYKSTLRAANTVDQKFGLLLPTSVPASANFSKLVKEYFHKFNQKQFYVKAAR